MKYTFEYNAQEDRENIINSNLEKYLIEERNIREGNFLIFTDVKPIELEVQEVKIKVEANLRATRKLIRVDELTTEELAEMIDLYDDYKKDYPYEENDVFKYGDKLYKVIQGHTSLENWIPDELPALYLNLMPDGVIPEWVQPAGYHDAYNIGDQVVFEDIVYESIIDANSWSPEAYPAGWKLV